MKKKSFIALGMALSLCISANTYALENVTKSFVKPNDIVYFHFPKEPNLDITVFNQLRYKILKQIGIGLTIERNTAYIFTEGTTYENCDITVTAKLQQYKDFKWQTIKTFKNSGQNVKECNVDEEYQVESGYDYRVETTVYVDNGNNTETVTRTGSTHFCD